MHESDAQSRFTKWIRQGNYNQSAAFELKLAKGNSALSYSSFQPQQLPMLHKAKHGCVYKKLSDLDPSLKPFDCLQICNSDAYIIAVWYHERKTLTAYWIDIDKFLEEQSSSSRKSITEQRAKELATKIIQL